jgi:hypothetical protein
VTWPTSAHAMLETRCWRLESQSCGSELFPAPLADSGAEFNYYTSIAQVHGAPWRLESHCSGMATRHVQLLCKHFTNPWGTVAP